MNGQNDRKPDFSEHFPSNDPELKIKADLGNKAHGAHHDVLQAIEGGTDQIRTSPQGEVLGGTTNIGPAKLPWE